ncbi:MAG: exosortase C-terminal domain/associated protein EpsI [Blastocatellia bacterium]
MKKHRHFIAMLLFLLLSAMAANYLLFAGGREQVPARASLAEVPQNFNGWRQIDEQSLSPGAARELGADDYLSRTYADDRGSRIFLFIAWYASQRHRRTFHSPQNCMPGAGWTMRDHKLHSLTSDSRGYAGEINEYRIEKDGAGMVALYWYHGRGRAIASEYWGRLHTIEDSLRLGRTDGALVRVIAPVGQGDGAEQQARRAGFDFIQKLTPLLPRFVPD